MPVWETSSRIESGSMSFTASTTVKLRGTGLATDWPAEGFRFKKKGKAST